MQKNPLNIVAVEGKPTQFSKKEDMRKKVEKAWSTNPEQFNPMNNCMDRERIDRTWHVINEFFQPMGKRVVDIGCGYGILAQLLAERGAFVDGIEISSKALELLQQKRHQNVNLIHDIFPNTKLRDNHYDLVICADVLAELAFPEYRLCFSELSRLSTKEGYILCSSPLDIYSEDALQRFEALAQTECTLLKIVLSHHAYYIRLCKLLKAPELFYRAHKDSEFRLQQIQERTGVSQWLFKVNSSTIPSIFWNLLHYITSPILSWVKQSKSLLLFLEKLCRFINYEQGISHVIFIGKRRTIQLPQQEIEEQEQLFKAREKKERKWE